MPVDCTENDTAIALTEVLNALSKELESGRLADHVDGSTTGSTCTDPVGSTCDATRGSTSGGATQGGGGRLTLDHALYVHLFLENMGHFAAANAVYCKRFPGSNPPARACVQVSNWGCHATFAWGDAAIAPSRNTSTHEA